MKNITKWLIIFSIFFFATLAVLIVDEQCMYMTGEGGKLVDILQVFVEF